MDGYVAEWPSVSANWVDNGVYEFVYEDVADLDDLVHKRRNKYFVPAVFAAFGWEVLAEGAFLF